MSVDVPFDPPVFLQTRFEPLEITASSGVPGAEVAQYAPVRWIAEYETPYLDRFDIGPAKVFLREQKGGTGRFWGFDFLNPWGRNYTASPTTMTRAAGAGGGSFSNGNALSISSMTTATVTVTGLPSSYVFLEGDHVGLSLGGKRSLHFVTSDVTASNGGGATVSVYPPISTANFTTSSTFTVYRARCVMRVDPGSVQTARRGRFEMVRFTATQVFYS